MPRRTVETPLGRLTVTEADGGITRLRWTFEEVEAQDDTPLLRDAERQLAAYFARSLTAFTLPLAPEASPAQQRFCALMAAIPYGETRTYGEMAKEAGISAQAAGQLCGGNPIPVIVPCHRVLGSSGLGGFSAPGGVETKVALLRLEGAASLLI